MENSSHLVLGKNSGYLELVMGPMKSGKTTYLKFHATRFADIGMSSLYINHLVDERKTEGGDGNSFTSHSSSDVYLSEKVKRVKTDKLRDVDVSDSDFIFIDEGSFYDDIVETVKFWINDLDKNVFIACLSGNFKRKSIGKCQDLYGEADKLTMIGSVCLFKDEGVVCHRYAPFTSKVGGDIGKSVEIGNDIYLPTCRKHHNKILSDSKNGATFS